MHRIYSSMALVVESRPYSEADRMITCYTREYGLISAVAKSVRLEKSKLRYALALYSMSEISLVKGKEIWRLTSAIYEKSFSANAQAVKKILSTLKRLIGEEIPDQFLFDALRAYLEYMHQKGEIDAKAAEVGIMLHILNRSGYLQASIPLADFLSTPFAPEKLGDVAIHKKEAIGLINQALEHAHL